MARLKAFYVCQQCGYISPSYLGRCPECQNWNTFVETVEEVGSGSSGSSLGGSGRKRSADSAKITNLSDVEKKDYDRFSSSLVEVDRVLGGGIVKGSIILVSGDPGIGKSTLLTQIALSASRQSSVVSPQQADKKSLKANSEAGLKTESSVLYIAGEESPQQIKLRVDRIKKDAPLAVLASTDVDLICERIEESKPKLVIIDSIQTLETSDLQSAAGSVGQVRECAHRLQRCGKRLHIPIIIVGHVTKEGTLAGPRTLEHLVDVVLSLEGEQNSQFRVLRANKNRFGGTDEVGIFEMEESGMVEVANPSKIFLGEKVNAPGSVVIATINGLRPILLEVQALVTKSNLPIPRRVSNGIDNNRLQLLVAVLTKRLKLPLFEQDVFVNVTGGLKVNEPAIDLGVAMAIISSFKDQSLPKNMVFVGEVGLLGELRSVRNLDKRLSEAKKLGFIESISPQNAKTLSDAAKKLFK